MKVALLLQFYFPYGGLQRDCLAMARGLAGRGVDVSIATRAWHGEKPEGIEVVVLGARGCGNVAMDRNFDHDVAAWLATREFDAVVGFSRLAATMDFYYAADPCYRVKVERDRSWFYRLTRKCRYYSDLEAGIFSKGGKTRLLLITSMEVPDYRERYGTEAERITVLPPSIRERKLGMREKVALRAEVRAEMQWPDGLPVAVFVGSGFATKGLDRAIAACASAPDTMKLCVVGGGKTASYRRLASRLGAGGRVEFLGARDDAWRLMAAADLMVHPARSENTGTVLVEALSAGTGVLTTDRCGFSNHVAASGAGRVLASPFEQAALDSALAGLLARPWQPRAELALEYAGKEDLYSGMKTAVDEVMAFLNGAQSVGS